MTNQHYPSLADLLKFIVDNSKNDFTELGLSRDTANQLREEINDVLQVKQVYTDRILELEHVKAVCNELQAKCDQLSMSSVKWLSVESKMPSDSRRVLAFDKDGFGVVTARYGAAGWYLEGDLSDGANVTLWAELPGDEL